jgi:hypothetical protein
VWIAPVIAHEIMTLVCFAMCFPPEELVVFVAPILDRDGVGCPPANVEFIHVNCCQRRIANPPF